MGPRTFLKVLGLVSLSACFLLTAGQVDACWRCRATSYGSCSDNGCRTQRFGPCDIFGLRRRCPPCETLLYTVALSWTYAEKYHVWRWQSAGAGSWIHAPDGCYGSGIEPYDFDPNTLAAPINSLINMTNFDKKLMKVPVSTASTTCRWCIFEWEGGVWRKREFCTGSCACPEPPTDSPTANHWNDSVTISIPQPPPMPPLTVIDANPWVLSVCKP